MARGWNLVHAGSSAKADDHGAAGQSIAEGAGSMRRSRSLRHPRLESLGLVTAADRPRRQIQSVRSEPRIRSDWGRLNWSSFENRRQASVFRGVGKGQKAVRRQAFLAELAVERLDENVVRRLPGPGEVERHAMEATPVGERVLTRGVHRRAGRRPLLAERVGEDVPLGDGLACGPLRAKMDMSMAATTEPRFAGAWVSALRIPWTRQRWRVALEEREALLSRNLETESCAVIAAYEKKIE